MHADACQAMYCMHMHRYIQARACIGQLGSTFTRGQTNGRTTGYKETRTGERTNGQTNGRTDERTIDSFSRRQNLSQILRLMHASVVKSPHLRLFVFTFTLLQFVHVWMSESTVKGPCKFVRSQGSSTSRVEAVADDPLFAAVLLSADEELPGLESGSLRGSLVHICEVLAVAMMFLRPRMSAALWMLSRARKPDELFF